MIGPLVPLILLGAVLGAIGVWVKQSRPQAADAAHAVVEARPARIPLLLEAVGYVGTILVLAGATAAIGQRWKDLSTGGRFAILGLATLVFLGIGLFIRSSEEPAVCRLTSVTWAVSVGALAGTTAVVNRSTTPRLVRRSSPSPRRRRSTPWCCGCSTSRPSSRRSCSWASC